MRTFTNQQQQENAPVVEVEEAGFWFDAKERGHVLVVGERGGEANEPDGLTWGLGVPERPGHEGLKHRTAVVVQQVNLVEDYQTNELRVRTLAAYKVLSLYAQS